MTGSPGERVDVSNGAALAALLAAGIGAFALGLIVILNEVGAFAVPAIYAPSGGVTGRTTLAVVIWLIAWAILHRLWKGREVQTGRVQTAALILTLLGVVLTFPPVWSLF
jgi:hypothetical protein